MTVKVYSTPTCPWCIKVKQYLKEKNIEFEDIDVSINQEAAQEMITKSGQSGVPVVDIDGKIVVGFDKGAIDEALAQGEKGGEENKETPKEEEGSEEDENKEASEESGEEKKEAKSAEGEEANEGEKKEA